VKTLRHAVDEAGHSVSHQGERKASITRRLCHSSWHPKIRPLGYSPEIMPYFYDDGGGEALLISGRKVV
jgi:hypothetical protein